MGLHIGDGERNSNKTSLGKLMPKLKKGRMKRSFRSIVRALRI